MDIIERVGDAREDLRVRHLQRRLTDATLEGRLQRQENRLLHEELDRQRAGRHRGRTVVTLGIAAGCAYVIGAKAGRARYEQVRRMIRWAERRLTA